MKTNTRLLCIIPLGQNTQTKISDQSNQIKLHKLHKISDILVINLKGTLRFYGGFPIIPEKQKEEKVCMGMFIMYSCIYIYGWHGSS